jgi:hypothetical protein
VWPTQPWFTILLELVCDVPLILKPFANLTVSPLGIPHPLLSTGSLRLASLERLHLAIFDPPPPLNRYAKKKTCRDRLLIEIDFDLSISFFLSIDQFFLIESDLSINAQN